MKLHIGIVIRAFLELWRKLARMRGLSALILVFDIVEDHGTAYAISEYMEGVSLREYLLRSPSGYLSWEQARILFMPVLSTLGTLHSAGIIHRGISPTTLIVGKNGKMRITGFSICRPALRVAISQRSYSRAMQQLSNMALRGSRALGRISMPLAPCFIER